MPYRMCRLSLGTGILEPIFNIDIPLKITGMCYIKDFGFLFLFRENHCLGYSDDHGKIILPWMGNMDEEGDDEGTSPLFDHPSSICYWPNFKTCFLFERGGSKLKSIDIHSKYCGRINLQDSFSRYFSKIENFDLMKTACDINIYGDLFWTVDSLNRCFKKKTEDNMVQNYIGNGHSGFSVSNHLNACSFSSPSGIKCVKDSIYISDSKNHCVREVHNNMVGLVMGNPLDEKVLSFPSQIVYNGGIIYVLDNAEIKYISSGDKNTGIIYSSPNIVAIEEAPKKGLYVLERT